MSLELKLRSLQDTAVVSFL